MADRARAELLQQIWLEVESEAIAHFRRQGPGARYVVMERRPLSVNPDHDTDRIPTIAFQIERLMPGYHDRRVWCVVAEGVVVAPWFDWPLCLVERCGSAAPEPAQGNDAVRSRRE